MAVSVVTINKLESGTQEKTRKMKWYPVKINDSNEKCAQKDKCICGTLY